jgi:hypothetical protein
VIGPVQHADPVEQFAHPPVDLVLRQPEEPQRQRHVLRRGEPPEQVRGLKHRADRAAGHPQLPR